MFKIFQISSELNVGSVGRIAEQIGEEIIAANGESYIAYGRERRESASHAITIGNKWSVIRHVILTRFTDRHGFGSKKATENLIREIRKVNPDIIHLQHVHGYFVNIELLFDYLSSANIPVVWTFHDCWSFTGHCAYYEFIGCEKWKTQCEKCPQIDKYPKSYRDNSYDNFLIKKRLFNAVPNLTIVPVSYWLGEETKKSFLNGNKIEVIQNGIDLETFNICEETDIREKYHIGDKFLILGVANPWDERKGLKYFLRLAEMIPDDMQILLVGLEEKIIKTLPRNIIGLQRTGNVQELAELYSAADVFVNPTLEDTFPTTNLEALACGTPVITFQSGGSPEAVDEYTGIVVEKGNQQKLYNAVLEIYKNTKLRYKEHCRKRAVENFNKKNAFKKYIELYHSVLNGNN